MLVVNMFMMLLCNMGPYLCKIRDENECNKISPVKDISQ